MGCCQGSSVGDTRSAPDTSEEEAKTKAKATAKQKEREREKERGQRMTHGTAEMAGQEREEARNKQKTQEATQSAARRVQGWQGSQRPQRSQRHPAQRVPVSGKRASHSVGTARNARAARTLEDRYAHPRATARNSQPMTVNRQILPIDARIPIPPPPKTSGPFQKRHTLTVGQSNGRKKKKKLKSRSKDDWYDESSEESSSDSNSRKAKWNARTSVVYTGRVTDAELRREAKKASQPRRRSAWEESSSEENGRDGRDGRDETSSESEMAIPDLHNAGATFKPKKRLTVELNRDMPIPGFAPQREPMTFVQ